MKFVFIVLAMLGSWGFLLSLLLFLTLVSKNFPIKELGTLVATCCACGSFTVLMSLSAIVKAIEENKS